MGINCTPFKGTTTTEQHSLICSLSCCVLFWFFFLFPVDLFRLSNYFDLCQQYANCNPILLIHSQTAKVVRRATRQEGRWARDTRGRGGRQGRWGHRRGWWGGRGGGRRGGRWGGRGGWGGGGGGRGGRRGRGGGRGGGGRRGRGGGGIDQSTLWARPRAPLSFTTFRKNKHYI